MPQLRAATRLARLRKRPDATDVLRDVYETFTEGFDTPDLLEARMVLDEVELGCNGIHPEEEPRAELGAPGGYC